MTDEAKEAFYDAEIAPALLALAEKCKERDIPFLAVVEWNPNDRGQTIVQIPDQSMAMTMLAYCARMENNLDGYVIGLIRYCRQKGIDISSSMVARVVGGEWPKVSAT